MLHESCIFYRFLPRRRLQSTNFYRAGASVLPISTGFYRAAVAVLPRKTEQIDHEETQVYQFLPGFFRNSTNFYRAVFEILPFSTVFYRFLPGGFSPHVGIHYALGSACSMCSICSVCSICSICSIGVVYVVHVVCRFLKPYNVARNLHCLPISTAPAPPFYQFLPVSTAARSPVYPKNTEQNDFEETQFCQFLPGVFRNSTVFYRFLPVASLLMLVYL